VDQDDSEKRITDLEHQLAEQKRGADLPPANAAPETGSGAPKPTPIGAWKWLPISLFLLFSIGGAWNSDRIGVKPWYEYRVGTPATATIETCLETKFPPVRTCTGRWSVGGVAQAGVISGPVEHLPVGSQVDVHVRGGTAYLAYWACPVYDVLFAGLAFASAFAYWCLWRKQKTGRWPWRGRRFKFFGLSRPPDRTSPT
jgi:hypothetical protein